MNKSLSVNGFEAEVISSCSLVAMEIKRLAREQGKPVTIIEANDKPKWARIAAGWLMFLIGVGSITGVLINWAKG